MDSDSPNRLLLLVVTVSFLAVVATIVELYGWPGLVGVVLAMALSALVILGSRAL